MGAALTFEKEKLIMGIIYSDKAIFNEVMDILTEKFGEVDLVCEEFSFSKEFSDYYDDELGGEGTRRIISFKKTVDPEDQADIKTYTNKLEMRFAVNGNRKINLDPGFINHGRLLLATTKETGFRIPLKDGIYTELTLYYARGRWQKLPWTYRDYQSERVQSFLTKVRKIYLTERKEILKNNKEVKKPI